MRNFKDRHILYINIGVGYGITHKLGLLDVYK